MILNLRMFVIKNFCHRWSRICSVCRRQNNVLFFNMSNTTSTCTTYEAGTTSTCTTNEAGTASTCTTNEAGTSSTCTTNEAGTSTCTTNEAGTTSIWTTNEAGTTSTCTTNETGTSNLRSIWVHLWFLLVSCYPLFIFLCSVLWTIVCIFALFLFFWPLYWLSSLDLSLLITPLVSSNNWIIRS